MPCPERLVETNMIFILQCLSKEITNYYPYNGNKYMVWSKCIGGAKVLIEAAWHWLTLNSVTHAQCYNFLPHFLCYGSAWNESVVVSLHHRGSIIDHGLCNSFGLYTTYNPRSKNRHIPQIWTTVIFKFSLQISNPLEMNQIWRCRGTARKSEYIPNMEFRNDWNQWKRRWIKCVGPRDIKCRINWCILIFIEPAPIIFYLVFNMYIP